MKSTKRETNLGFSELGRCMICYSSIRDYEHNILLANGLAETCNVPLYFPYQHQSIFQADWLDVNPVEGDFLCDICRLIADQFASKQEKVIPKLLQEKFNELKKKETVDGKKTFQMEQQLDIQVELSSSHQATITASPILNLLLQKAPPSQNAIPMVVHRDFPTTPNYTFPPVRSDEFKDLAPPIPPTHLRNSNMTLSSKDEIKEATQQISQEEAFSSPCPNSQVQNDNFLSLSAQVFSEKSMSISISAQETADGPPALSFSCSQIISDDSFTPPTTNGTLSEPSLPNIVTQAVSDEQTLPPKMAPDEKRKRGRPRKNKENGEPGLKKCNKNEERSFLRQSPNLHGRQRCWKEREGKLYFRDVEVKRGTEDDYLCPSSACSYSSSSRIALSRHFNKVHFDSSNAYKCEYCDNKYFYYHSDLLQHMFQKHGNGFQCTICKITLCTPAALRHHREVTHNRIKPHICEYCDRGFGSKMEWKVHTRIHTGEKPFVCSICNAKFAYKKTLKRHMPVKHPSYLPLLK